MPPVINSQLQIEDRSHDGGVAAGQRRLASCGKSSKWKRVRSRSNRLAPRVDPRSPISNPACLPRSRERERERAIQRGGGRGRSRCVADPRQPIDRRIDKLSGSPSRRFIVPLMRPDAERARDRDRQRNARERTLRPSTGSDRIRTRARLNSQARSSCSSRSNRQLGYRSRRIRESSETLAHAKLGALRDSCWGDVSFVVEFSPSGRGTRLSWCIPRYRGNLPHSPVTFAELSCRAFFTGGTK